MSQFKLTKKQQETLDLLNRKEFKHIASRVHSKRASKLADLGILEWEYIGKRKCYRINSLSALNLIYDIRKVNWYYYAEECIEDHFNVFVSATDESGSNLKRVRIDELTEDSFKVVTATLLNQRSIEPTDELVEFFCEMAGYRSK